MKPDRWSATPRTIDPATSFYVWGNDRRRLNRAVRAIAGAIDPEFEWIESVEDHDRSGDPRASPVHRPDRPVPAVVARGVAAGASEPRDPRVSASRCRMAGELYGSPSVRPGPGLLPAPVVRLLAHPPPRALVVANADRLGSSRPENPVGLGHLVEPLNWMGITLFATHPGRPSADRACFDYSLAEVSTLPLPVPKEWALVCQWGNCERCLVRERFGPEGVGCFGSVLAALRQRRSKETEGLGSRDRSPAPLVRPSSP